MTNCEIPYLRPTPSSSQLIVNGQPFLMLPAELQNSSLSSADYMSTVWDNLKSCNFNTLLGGVPWEMIEPREGDYNFTEIDRIILDARQKELRLVLLWFGSSKSGSSSYAPGWVKTDLHRFPRMKIREEDKQLKAIDAVSPFCEEAWQVESKAFSALMRHVKELDAQHHTVVMVQVQNECGVLKDSRDRSDLAEAAFRQAVPSALLEHLAGKQILHPDFDKRWPGFREYVAGQLPTSWEQVFGLGVPAEEVFMAHALATYVERLAEAGKQEYPIPFFANVWLNTDDPSILDLGGISEKIGTHILAAGGSKPGDYPSGGPCPHTLDVWKFCAPSLDFIAPDTYLQEYESICKAYRHENQPLFIPEQRPDGRGARRTWLAYGSYGALGCSPFGVDEIAAADSAFRKPYGLLAKMSKHILAAQAANADDVFGFFFDPPTSVDSAKWVRKFGNLSLTVTRAFAFGQRTEGYGIIIHRGQGRFLLMGEGYEVRFESTETNTTYTGILEFDEIVVDEKGNLTKGRKLNGDERRGGEVAVMPAENPDYAGFPIRITVKARTYVAKCVAYSV
ncbi:glycoside hydrolase superfamily [Aspergillus carlsbadensis]|nr:glycoside hydrolase superfamily [Aspergillus carlsbadensis]